MLPHKPNKCLFCDELYCYSLLTVLHVHLIISSWLKSGKFPGTLDSDVELFLIWLSSFLIKMKTQLQINPSDQFTSGGMTYILLSFLLQLHRKIPTITDTITHKAKALIRWILAREEHKPSHWLWSRYARLRCCQGNSSQLGPHPSLKTAFHTVSFKKSRAKFQRGDVLKWKRIVKIDALRTEDALNNVFSTGFRVTHSEKKLLI